MNPTESRHLDPTWKGLALASMALVFCLLAACAPPGGGCVHADFIRTPQSNVQVYDPPSDSWTEGTPMPVKLDGLRATNLGGLIYAVSGATRSVSIRSPIHGTGFRIHPGGSA
ncbi:MAG: kelch repeat-containing protein [Planctomycetota bacterium]|nr:kelch repeat-containing protein [Planctomycetota bacterium]